MQEGHSALGPMFHGTTHSFKEGDIVSPRGGDYAYATPHLDYATSHVERSYGKRWEEAKRDNPTYNKPGGKQYEEWESEQKPNVYQVEPLDKPEATGYGDDKGNYMSKQGFKVVKQVK